MKNKTPWINLSLVNLCIVALLGLVLRSKILFPIRFIDYRNFLSTHSHFAFAGWVSLVLITFLISELLPTELSGKKIYQWILAAIEVSALGMAFSFPWKGYAAASIFFSTFYIVVTYVFAVVFIRDLWKSRQQKVVRLLSVSSLASLVISSIGPFVLSYIMITRSGDSILYRDAIYTFLHFQYNGFFTLAVFALFFNRLIQKGKIIGKNLNRFAVMIYISVLPSLFLSLLWHGNKVYYGIATAGCLLIALALYFFTAAVIKREMKEVFSYPLAKTLWLFSFLSFALKMLLNAGTIIPQLGHAVYGDRPVIIGFLHLVFLGFVTFFILSHLIEQEYFTRQQKIIAVPFYVFTSGIMLNELFLMVQGLGILFRTNSGIYNWLLWMAAIVLFAGSIQILYARYQSDASRHHARILE